MKINTTIFPNVTLTTTETYGRLYTLINVYYQEKEIGVIGWSNRKNAIDNIEVFEPSKEPRIAIFLALVHNENKIREWVNICG